MSNFVTSRVRILLITGIALILIGPLFRLIVQNRLPKFQLTSVIGDRLDKVGEAIIIAALVAWCVERVTKLELLAELSEMITQSDAFLFHRMPTSTKDLIKEILATPFSRFGYTIEYTMELAPTGKHVDVRTKASYVVVNNGLAPRTHDLKFFIEDPLDPKLREFSKFVVVRGTMNGKEVDFLDSSSGATQRRVGRSNQGPARIELEARTRLEAGGKLQVEAHYMFAKSLADTERWVMGIPTEDMLMTLVLPSSATSGEGGSAPLWGATALHPKPLQFLDQPDRIVQKLSIVGGLLPQQGIFLNWDFSDGVSGASERDARSEQPAQIDMRLDHAALVAEVERTL